MRIVHPKVSQNGNIDVAKAQRYPARPHFFRFLKVEPEKTVPKQIVFSSIIG